VGLVVKKNLLLLLVLAINTFAQQISVAVLPSDGATLNSDELEALTDKMREAALKVLPTNAFVLLKQDVVFKRLGGMENYIKECEENNCIVNLGKKAQVEYVAKASVGKLGNKIRLKVELYNVRTEGLLGILSDGESENIKGLLAIVEKRVPIEVFSKIPGASGGKPPTAAIAGGISGVQTTGGNYELDGGKSYLANLSTEPSGAVLSFDGLPSSSCPKTPCKAELREGNVRIIAALEQYERADTTVFIKQNNQGIAIKLKPNFGVLEIKPAYLDGIGSDKPWNLSINDKLYSLLYSLDKINLSPNRYKVKLNHECYDVIGFDVGINKGKSEVFDIASKIALKKGGLILSAERNGEPTSEPVFVNGKLVGETPFSGSVPLCAKVEIGEGKEMVDVNLKHNEKVKYTHKSTESQVGKYLIDSRDGKKYKIVKIGTQTWMAENLNYAGQNDDIGYCLGKDPKNCKKYGALYTWDEAMKICPSGWHLPSKDEWETLVDFAGGEIIAGKKLKAKGAWSEGECKYTTEETTGRGKVTVIEHDYCATDEFGFSALPGELCYSLNPDCYRVANFSVSGYLWSSSRSSNSIYSFNIHKYNKYYPDNSVVYLSDNPRASLSISKNSLLSVRCLQGSGETKIRRNNE